MQVPMEYLETIVMVKFTRTIVFFHANLGAQQILFYYDEVEVMIVCVEVQAW